MLCKLHATDLSPIVASWHLGRLSTQDIGVTGVEDGDGRASEEFTAGGSQLDLFIW